MHLNHISCFEYYKGAHPGDLLHLWQNQDDRHAIEPRLPSPVQMLCVCGVWDAGGSGEGAQTHGWRWGDEHNGSTGGKRSLVQIQVMCVIALCRSDRRSGDHSHSCAHSHRAPSSPQAVPASQVTSPTTHVATHPAPHEEKVSWAVARIMFYWPSLRHANTWHFLVGLGLPGDALQSAAGLGLPGAAVIAHAPAPIPPASD